MVAMRFERRLRSGSGCHSLRRIREPDEESITFGIDHHTTMRRPDVPQQPIRHTQDIPVQIPYLVQQPR